MEKPVYIDLHCHPGLKTFLSAEIEPDRTPCWKNLHLGWFSRVIDQLFLASMLWSNSSLSQLINGRVLVAVVGLYSYEITMFKGRLKTLKCLNLLRFIKILNALWNKDLSGKLIENISSHSGEKYFDIFSDIQTHLLKSQNYAIANRYELLDKISKLDPNKLNVILSIEGGHNLFSKKTNDPQFAKSVLDNLDFFKNSGLRYLFLGLAHLESNPLCTHAYGMKIIDDVRFKPNGYGISPLGKKVIIKALDDDPYKMLIDIKHMSLKSRMDFYDMIDKGEIPDNTPIIMSHAGITGVSYTEMPVIKYKLKDNWYKVVYYKKHGLMRTDFNPWSINLYDEDIKRIIDSGGIIGINFDERILGTKQSTKRELTEYFSKEEFDYYKQLIDYDIVAKIRDLNKPIRGVRKWFSSYMDIKYVCNNILHIVLVGGDKAWNHICIGSDFDGMINTVEYYQSAEKLLKLHSDLIKWLPRMAESDPDPNHDYYITDIKLQVQKIMYGNARAFLGMYFN